MKKVLLLAAVVATVGFTSCGGIDTKKATEEFCACAEKEGEDRTKCHDEWIAKYKDAKAKEEDAKKMGEDMMKCDMAGAVEVLQKASK